MPYRTWTFSPQYFLLLFSPHRSYMSKAHRSRIFPMPDTPLSFPPALGSLPSLRILKAPLFRLNLRDNIVVGGKSQKVGVPSIFFELHFSVPPLPPPHGDKPDSINLSFCWRSRLVFILLVRETHLFFVFSCPSPQITSSLSPTYPKQSVSSK